MGSLALCPGYVPHEHQRRVHQSGKRFVAIAAGARGGKSKCGGAEFAVRIARDIATKPGRVAAGAGRHRRAKFHYWVVAPIAGLLKEPRRYVFEAFPQGMIERYYENDSSLWLKGDVLIEFKTADNPLHLVSVGLDGIWIDEVARVKPDAWRGQLRQRLSDRMGWGIFTTTPLGRNWFHDEIVSRAGTPGFESYDFLHWTTSGNPHIPREEIAEAKATLPWRYYQREYEASFEAFVGLVYDEWSEAAHVVTEDALRAEYGIGVKPLRSLFQRVIAGVDWGWNSPASIVVVGDTGRELIVLDEVYVTNRVVFDGRNQDNTLVGDARQMVGKWGVSLFYPDPSQPQSLYDFQRAGLPVTGAENDILYGVRKVSEALHLENGKPRMRVLDTCRNVRREIAAYMWAGDKAGSGFVDMPADGQSDHALDALRYAVVELRRYAPADEGADLRYRMQRPAPRYAPGPVG